MCRLLLLPGGHAQVLSSVVLPLHQMELFYWHGLVPYSAYVTWNAQCDGANSNSATCNALLNEYTALIGNFDPVRRHGHPQLHVGFSGCKCNRVFLVYVIGAFGDCAGQSVHQLFHR